MKCPSWLFYQRPSNNLLIVEQSLSSNPFRQISIFACVFAATYSACIGEHAKLIAAENITPLANAILGSWTIEYYDSDGSVDTTVHAVLEFNLDRKMSIRQPHEVTVDGKFVIGSETIDASEFDMTWNDESGLKWIGLAKIKDDKLWICGFIDSGKKRPSRFLDRKTMGGWLMILKRGQ